ncbi:MAG: long-chain fatty acid--CoA ligase [Spirochaetae bacterium HGW-Spirochaetae-1]|jgi:long-chain acyl-CoA synthetase|nr:MAG: long-chain fatty acid--CoA ligase [Spirochaetae bacterium HGW-Spirochaetae-1]
MNSTVRSEVHEITENSVCGIFLNRVKANADEPCVAYRKEDTFHDVTWREMGDMVHSLGAWMIHEGVVRGDRIAIFSGTRYEWWITDLASLLTGAADVPIYATNTAHEAYYILSHSAACLCFTGDREQTDKVLAVRDSLPALRKIIVFDDILIDDPMVITFQKAIEEGRQRLDLLNPDSAQNAITPRDLATIIYTSGTTGDPKGVMLSHGNLIANVRQVHDHYRNKLTIKHDFLSFLPLSHALERMGGYYLAISTNTKVSFARDISTLLEDLKAVRPTSFVAVPRMFEKIYHAVQQRVRESRKLRRIIFSRAMNVARKNVEYLAHDRERKGIFALRYALAHRLVFSRIKNNLGMERIRFAVSGGNALSGEIARFFMGLDIRIIEGYGLTETSPVVSANRPDLIKPGAVGKIVQGTDVRISPDGEILIRGPQVMTGYYRDDAATAEAFTDDGFFKTGDLGFFDNDGYLRVSGRIKDIIITSGGKNISPMNIETNLMYSKYIEQAVVIGDGRNFLTALVVPDFENLEAWAVREGIAFGSRKELLLHEKVRSLFSDEIDHYQKDFSRVEQVKKYTLMDEPWSQEQGELTPSMKVKRRVINERYAEIIESMYNEKNPEV